MSRPLCASNYAPGVRRENATAIRHTKGARGGPRASSRRAVGAAELQNGSVEAAEADVYYCWINSKAMAEGRKRVAICAMKQERPQLVWLCVHPTH